MRKRISQPDQASEVDMTPMLDIVFIMLIFFIVTTSFVKETGITIDQPSKSPTPTLTTVTNTLVIQINELEDVFFAGRLILQDAVQANIEIALSQNPDAQILVKVDESAGTGVLVDVVDQVKLAGIGQITVSRI